MLADGLRVPHMSDYTERCGATRGSREPEALRAPSPLKHLQPSWDRAPGAEQRCSPGRPSPRPFNDVFNIAVPIENWGVQSDDTMTDT
eukprot:COSAG02_NODE_29420_length_569_cov_1.208511_1_plen_87_part_01